MHIRLALFVLLVIAAIFLFSPKVPKIVLVDREITPTSTAGVKINAYFTTVNKQGQPVRPDKAWWYYAPNKQGKAEEHPARCMNPECTRWEVTGATGEKIYIGASTSRKQTNSPCFNSAYNAFPITIGPGKIPEVKIILEEHMVCE